MFIKKMNEKGDDNILRKLKFYFDNHVDVHIKTLDTGRFYNGCITKLGSDFLIIKDRKLNEVMLMISEIESPEPFTETK